MLCYHPRQKFMHLSDLHEISFIHLDRQAKSQEMVRLVLSVILPPPPSPSRKNHVVPTKKNCKISNSSHLGLLIKYSLCSLKICLILLSGIVQEWDKRGPDLRNSGKVREWKDASTVRGFRLHSVLEIPCPTYACFFYRSFLWRNFVHYVCKWRGIRRQMHHAQSCSKRRNPQCYSRIQE